MTDAPTPETSSKQRHKLGLALGSGAVRGWAHIGVLKALDELGVEVEVITGTSIGALVGGAKLLGILDEFIKWAEKLKPYNALTQFNLSISHGGLINVDPVFKMFLPNDKPIEDLPLPFGAVATDLGTGEEVWLETGSVMDAVRASTAIPTMFRAVSYTHNEAQQWLVDGGLTNPVPVDLCRHLGADYVIAVELNNNASTIERFANQQRQDVIPTEKSRLPEKTILPEPAARLVQDTQDFVDRKIKMVHAHHKSKPHLMETALATFDIVQSQIGALRAQIDTPDLRLLPDMQGLSPMALDKSDDFIKAGYQVTMAHKDDILKIKAKCSTTCEEMNAS